MIKFQEEQFPHKYTICYSDWDSKFYKWKLYLFIAQNEKKRLWFNMQFNLKMYIT